MTTYPIRCHLRAEAGTTRVEVYDDIGQGGWTGGGLTAGDFTARLADVKGPLDVHINSGGGSVKDGTAIANAIRGHKGPTRTIVDGMAASIASVIMQAGQERVIQPGAMVMIHDASSECYGNAADMSKMAADLDKHSDNLASIYAARAGGNPAQWRDAMRAETWYTADEAVAAGLADKVGTDTAALPTDFGLAAYHPVPDRIVARLKEMPRREIRAAYTPQPYTHESWENVKCPVCGKFSDDDARYCGQCGIELAGRDDVTLTRTASKATDAASAAFRAAAGAPDEGEDAPDEEGPVCKMCGGRGRLKHQSTGKNSVKCPGCNGTGHVTPDDEPEEPEDEPDGSAALHRQALAWLRQTPGVRDPNTPPAADAVTVMAQALVAAGFTPEALLAAAEVDQSDWDGPKAMSMAAKSSDPAAAYKEICAGTKAGDPSKQSSWALPYRYPGKPINAAGVRNALSRLPQTEGLTNKAAAQALLERLMKQINPDYDGGESSNAMPTWIHNTAPEVPAWLNSAKEAK
jgi:ATP-dependent protease ClpP protease subunit